MLRIFVAVVLLATLLGSLPHAVRADEPFGKRLAGAALVRTFVDVTYDGSYYSIPYPGGDVPADKGVCTDVVIRSYRALGIDLQRLVHEDMRAHFHRYPKLWGLKRPDPNIDHRRVPNLQVFFTRHGKSLPIPGTSKGYLPGDLVTWNVSASGDLPHIGIVTEKHSKSGMPMIVHNIGGGPVLEDMLFRYEMTGHYRYTGK